MQRSLHQVFFSEAVVTRLTGDGDYRERSNRDRLSLFVDGGPLANPKSGISMHPVQPDGNGPSSVVHREGGPRDGLGQMQDAGPKERQSCAPKVAIAIPFLVLPAPTAIDRLPNELQLRYLSNAHARLRETGAFV